MHAAVMCTSNAKVAILYKVSCEQGARRVPTRCQLTSSMLAALTALTWSSRQQKPRDSSRHHAADAQRFQSTAERVHMHHTYLATGRTERAGSKTQQPSSSTCGCCEHRGFGLRDIRMWAVLCPTKGSASSSTALLAGDSCWSDLACRS